MRKLPVCFAVLIFSLMALSDPLVSEAHPNNLRENTPAFGGTPSRIWVFKGHTDKINSLVFSPDNRYLLSASWDNTARLWEVQTRQEKYTLAGHTESVQTAVFSPDGSYILTASLDKTARLWDVQTGITLHRFAGHTAAVLTAYFSADGRYALTASRDGTARLWEVQTGQAIRTFTGHTADVMSARFSPDGKTILTASLDHTARLWDLDTGKLIYTFTTTTFVRTALFSPDGAYALTLDLDDNVRLWNIQSGQNGATQTHKGLLGAGFSPDGKHLVTVGESGARLWVWDSPRGVFLSELQELSEYSIYSATFSADGQYLVTANWNMMAFSPQLWDVQRKQRVRTFQRCGQIDHIVFSSDSNYLAAACEDHTLKLMETLINPTPEIDLTSVPEGHTPQGHTRWRLGSYIGTAIYTPLFSTDSQTVIYHFTDSSTRLWSIQTKEPSKPYKGGHGNLSPDGKFLVTAGSGSTATLWDVQTGESVRKYEADSNIWDALISPDGSYILTSGPYNSHLWDLKTGKLLHLLQTGTVDHVLFSPDSRYVFTGTRRNVIEQWQLQTGISVHTYPGHQMMLSTDGKYLLLRSIDRKSGTTRPLPQAELWNTQRGQFIHTFDSFSEGTLSPDGHYVLAGSTDGTAILWDIQTEETVRTFSGHTDSITGAAFSSDSKYLLTASADHTTLLWEVQGGQPIRIFREGVANVTGIQFSPDSRHIVAVTAAYTLWVWESGIGQ